MCALLNSKLIKYWFKKCGKLQGNNYQLDSEPLMKVPINICDKEHSYKIELLFDKIINSEGNDINSINEIDMLVYKIYNITDEEKIYIENEINN